MKTLISAADLRNQLRISTTTEHRWRGSILPEPIKLGRRVYYLESDLKDLLARKVRASCD